MPRNINKLSPLHEVNEENDDDLKPKKNLMI